LTRMSSASLTRAIGWRRWFQPSQKRRIAVTRVGNARKLPRRIAWRVRIAKAVVFAIEERLATVLEIAERQLRSDEEP
jgi:hypothetical protein